MSAPAHVADLPVLVLGAGRSGAAAARALLDAGADVRVVDAGRSDELARTAAGFDARGALVRIDTPLDRAGLLDGVALVVTSPGIAPTTGAITEAARRGIPVWSEPELAWQLAGGATRVVGVTGTNGKTTTTELVAAALGVPAAGNIGTPLVELLAAPAPPPLVVAELSSFQLHSTHTLRCEVGVLLNVADDHLAWHGDRAAYRRDKARIWAGQQTGTSGDALDGRDWAVVGVDDGGVREVLAAHPPPAGVLGFTTAPPRPGEVGVDDGWIVAHLPNREPQRVVEIAQLGVRGPHNVANVSAAVGAALATGAAADGLAAPLAAYRPGGHRLAVVAERGGVTYVDDSKATNPHAAAAALGSFPSIVWIAGGLAKGVDMASLDPLLVDRVRGVVTIGTDGPSIAARARRLGIPTTEAGELAAAVPIAARLARPGDTVLLAPACASMDQFRDYAERGEVFVHLVLALDATATTGERTDTATTHASPGRDVVGGA
jgi:UDP-N-acetylmuramoylalanine--D-glutamate ligase